LDPKVGLVDRKIRPDTIEDVPSTDDLSAMLQQQRENIEGPASELNRLLPHEEQPFGRDQSIRPKLDRFKLTEFSWQMLYLGLAYSGRRLGSELKSDPTDQLACPVAGAMRPPSRFM
jgi:hypothetical protein